MMKKSIKILIILTLIFSAAKISFASETNGTITTGGNAGYAWSNQAGWVNFGATNGNIVITDSGITGYAWNDNYGWINMAPTNGGVLVSASGALSGFAWSAGLGWINFSGVSINSSGKFVGQATGTSIGTLTFDCANCSMTTDYRPVNFRAVAPLVSSTTGSVILPGLYVAPPVAPPIDPTTLVPTIPVAPTSLATSPSFDSNLSALRDLKLLTESSSIKIRQEDGEKFISEFESSPESAPLFDIEVSPGPAQVEKAVVSSKTSVRSRIIFPLILILGLLLIFVYRKIYARRF